jgi:peptidoglycan/LPS O-acetylase OafA/YrhL
MKNTTSSFLDILRIISALAVFASHCAQMWNDSASEILRPYAHHAVVAFFVISGYVIAFATMGRSNVTGRAYAAARISRLYSVVIPAIILTIALQIIGTAIAADAYSKVSRGFDGLRYALCTVFMQSSWFLSASPPTNGPFWSLSYEAWYYAAFGVWFFTSSKTLKIALLCITLLAAGPNIILLAPAWMIGVFAYSYTNKQTNKQTKFNPTALIFFGSLQIILVHTLFLDQPFNPGAKPLFFSAAFLTDWLVAIGFAAIIAGVGQLDLKISDERAAKLRNLGDLTFPVYLFHFPVLFFITATTQYKPATLGEAIAWATLLLAVIIAISTFTERYRASWRSLFERIVNRVAPSQVTHPG